MALCQSHVGMILGENMKTYFRNEDCWKMSKSGILFRKWIWKTGVCQYLPVVGQAGLEELFFKLHQKASEKPIKSPIDVGFASHPSGKVTFEILKKQVYAFHLRRNLAQLKKTCAICTLKNYTTNVQSRDEGMSKALQGFETIETDFIGPLGAEKSYVLVFVDAVTNMIWAYHSQNN
jgi:hypothetical protein